MTEGEPQIFLDTQEHCRLELQRVSNAMVELVGQYSRARKTLGDMEEQVELLKARTLLTTEGANKEEREAKVLVAMDDDPDVAPILVEYHEAKIEVDVLKVRLKALENRGTNAANSNNSLSQESKFQGRVNL